MLHDLIKSISRLRSGLYNSVKLGQYTTPIDFPHLWQRYTSTMLKQNQREQATGVEQHVPHMTT